MLPAAFWQFAVSVTADVSDGDEGDCPIEQLNVPGAVVWQFSVKLPPPLSTRVNELQVELLKVNVAASEGDDAGTASKARVNATATSAPAARTSNRFISDSQAQRQSGGPMPPASSAPAFQ